MNSPSNHNGEEQIPDELLEEFALGRAAGEQRSRLEERLEADPLLSERFERIRKEALKMRAFLESQAESMADEPLSDEILAMYLDDSLTPSDRQDVEERLSRDRAAQRRLAELFRDVKDAQDRDASPVWVDAPPSSSPSSDARRDALGLHVMAASADTGTRSSPGRRLGIALMAVGAVFGLVGIAMPAFMALPVSFAGLGIFSFGVTELISRRGAAGVGRPQRRSRFWHGLLLGAAALLFAAGAFSPVGSLVFFVGALGSFWGWQAVRIGERLKAREEESVSAEDSGEDAAVKTQNSTR